MPCRPAKSEVQHTSKLIVPSMNLKYSNGEFIPCDEAWFVIVSGPVAELLLPQPPPKATFGKGRGGLLISGREHPPATHSLLFSHKQHAG